jgi:citrate lyase subunit beta/citryl-CoA lyase
MRRSKLAVPGHDATALASAAKSGADIVQIDLEDSIPGGLKEMARATALTALTELDWGRAEKWVKVDHTSTVECAASVRATMAGQPDAYALAKVEEPHDMARLAEILDSEEQAFGVTAGRTSMVAIIERIRGLSTVEEIASSHRRMTALGMGPFDLGQEYGYRLDLSGPSMETLYAKSRSILAARLAGIDISDMGYLFEDDAEGTIRSTLYSLQLGFTTKSTHSPRQVSLIHTAFELNESLSRLPQKWL